MTLNLALWIVQALLAAVFVASGAVKALWSKQRLVQSGQTGLRGIREPTIRFIAISELLGAFGLILPWASGIGRALTPLAAACLGVVMILAARVHARQREPKNVALNFALLAACAVVVVGRGLAA